MIRIKWILIKRKKPSVPRAYPQILFYTNTFEKLHLKIISKLQLSQTLYNYLASPTHIYSHIPGR